MFFPLLFSSSRTKKKLIFFSSSLSRDLQERRKKKNSIAAAHHQPRHSATTTSSFLLSSSSSSPSSLCLSRNSQPPRARLAEEKSRRRRVAVAADRGRTPEIKWERAEEIDFIASKVRKFLLRNQFWSLGIWNLIWGFRVLRGFLRKFMWFMDVWAWLVMLIIWIGVLNSNILDLVWIFGRISWIGLEIWIVGALEFLELFDDYKTFMWLLNVWVRS